MVTIGFRVGWRDCARLQARLFLLQPDGEAAGILGIERNGFGRQIGTTVQLLLPCSDFIPHDGSMLSAQLHYRHSFWRDTSYDSADNIPHSWENCADKPAFGSSFAFLGTHHA